MSDKRRRLKVFATAGVLYSLLTACATWQSFVREVKRAPEPNRGVIANHDIHAADGLDCSDCHTVSTGERVSIVDHDICSVCHDIPDNSLTSPLTYVDDVSCKMCHTRDDYSITPRRNFITDEIRFDHQVHVTAKVSCTECHESPDRPRTYDDMLMTQCMNCHEQTSHAFSSIAKTTAKAEDFHGNECTVCHRELTKETIPEYRHGQRIAHDSTLAWKKLHGHESYVDATYCAQCHVEEEDCMTCHRIMKPDNHTLAWNRRLHGVHAGWDSQSCSVCHEEDSCMKCHSHTEPVSHTGNFGAPRNNHCVQCHFPAETEIGCAVCHESIDHRSAPTTPHDDDLNFPGNCALCHPGGIPGAVPHRNNLSTDCRTCHQ
ncbi:MAG: cytochrome c3 family protein [Candidatus Hydrogenedentota bacterium]